MKSAFFSFLLFVGVFINAQVDVEDNMDNLPLVDNVTSSVAYSVKGVYQLKDDKCQNNFVSLKYPGGTNAFIQEFKEKMDQSVNWESYAINGMFYIKMDINKNGEITNVDAGPKVANSDLFLYDLKQAAKKITKKWKPATCDGKDVDSQAIIKIDFSSVIVESLVN